MDLRRFSGIARPVDTGYRTNRWIAIATLATFAAAWAVLGLTGAGWLDGLGQAAAAALAVFLGWALTRELDPDPEPAALAAAALTLPALMLLGLPDLAALFLLLLAMRVLNRTTGVAATPADGLGMLGLALWLSVQGQPVYLGAVGLALMADGMLPPASTRRLSIGIGAAVLAAAVLIIISPEGPPPEPTVGSALIGLVLALMLVPALLAAGRLTSLADDTGEPLSTLRVRLGQVLALVTALGVILWQGAAGLTALLPLWAGVVATALWRLLVKPPSSAS
jgi:hypothetical protein